MPNYDLSDLGGISVKKQSGANYDLSDLGGIKEEKQPSLKKRAEDEMSAFAQHPLQSFKGALTDPGNPIADFMQSGGQTLENQGINALNLLHGVNIPQQQGANTNSISGMLGGATGGAMGYAIPEMGIERAISGIPTIANAINPLARSIIGGGAISAAEAPTGERGRSAALGALVPSVLAGGTATKNALSNLGVSSLSQYAAPGIAKQSMSEIKSPISNEQAFDMAALNYKKYMDDEKSAWDSLKSKAVIADHTPGVNFNNSDYLKNLDNKINDFNQKMAQSGGERKYGDAKDILEGYKNDPHSSFMQALEHNQALNYDYSNEISPGKSVPFDAVNYAIGNLKKSIQKNLKDNGLEDTLGKSFQDANKATTDKNQIFHDVISPKGKEQYSSFSNFLNNKSPFGDRGNFVKDYLPSGTKENVGRMQQFSQMVGNDDAAKSVIKNNYFGIDKGIGPESFINKFNKLNPDEQSYLFNPSQLKSINALNNVLKQHPGALDKKNALDMFHSTLGAGAGLGLGMLTGHGVEGTMLGALSGNALRSAVTKGLSTPMMTKGFINKLNAPATQSQFNPQLNALLTGGLLSQVNQ